MNHRIQQISNKWKTYSCAVIGTAMLFSCTLDQNIPSGSTQAPVDFVNPYMGNISHLLVPTYPTVHLPNSMLRVYPERGDFTGDRLNGLPIVVTNHRE